MIREAKPEDFTRVKELYEQLNPDDLPLGDGTEGTVFDEILSTRNLHLFVLEDDNGSVEATCYLNIVPNITRQASPYGIIENVIVDTGHRNQGFGKKIVEYALQFAWDRGCYKVMLQTGSKRESTHNFYKVCGFSGTDKFAFVARPQ